MIIILLLMFIVSLGNSSLIYKATSSLSFFEHSYFANMNNDYLTGNRLQYYQLEKFFTQACPMPQLSESIFLATPEVLEEAYLR